MDHLCPPGECECEFSPIPGDSEEGTPETAWHYFRTCSHCSEQWYGVHCPHDGIQNPCPKCGNVPLPQCECGDTANVAEDLAFHQRRSGNVQHGNMAAHCGCPVCRLKCDACMEEELRRT